MSTVQQRHNPISLVVQQSPHSHTSHYPLTMPKHLTLIAYKPDSQSADQFMVYVDPIQVRESYFEQCSVLNRCS